MRILTKQEILAANDLAREFVSTGEWANGDTEAGVYVRGMTAAERDSYEKGIINRNILAQGRTTKVEMAFNDNYFDNLKAKLCARCICDDQGERVFSDDDIEALGRKSAAPLDRIAAVAQRLSALTPEDVDALGKASEPTPSVGSSSSSPLSVVEPTSKPSRNHLAPAI